jgi:hypothetical protein
MTDKQKADKIRELLSEALKITKDLTRAGYTVALCGYDGERTPLYSVYRVDIVAQVCL